MIRLALALLLQALEEGASVPLPCRDPMLIAASSTGRFLVVAEARKAHILDGDTLTPVHAVEFECTAVGFDAKDEILTVVGREVVRLRTKDWKTAFRAELPDVELRKAAAVVGGIVVDLRRLDPPDGWLAGQALVGRDGAVYYRSKDGHLSVAREVEGKLAGEVLTSERREDFHAVHRVLAVLPDTILVDLGGATGIVLRKRLYTLAASGFPLALGASGDTVSGVHRRTFNVYSSKSWKNLGARAVEEEGEGPRPARRQLAPPATGEGNRAAVFDSKRSRFYIARGDGLRSWDGSKDAPDKPLEGMTGNFRGLALDGGATRLYGVERERLRSWRLKD